MLIINGKQEKIKDVAKRFGVPLEKLEKSSEFRFNEALKGYDLGSKSKRSPGGNRFPASFHATDKDGLNVEIRYAKSHTKNRDKAGILMDVFSPRKVEFMGDIDVPETLEEAIFKYLHPKCSQSPFRGNVSYPFTYEYVDKQQKAEKAIEKGDTMLKALQHAKNYSSTDLRLMAKGMGIENVDGKEEQELRADLSELAMKNPSEYLRKTNLNGTIFDGRIMDAIDSGLFIKKESFGVERWEWNAGVNKGQTICEISNRSISAQEFLRNHIKSNLNQYYAQITNIQNEMDAEKKAEAFLSQQRASVQPEEEETVVEPEDTDFVPTEFPTNFNESVAYIQARTEDNKRPSNTVASKLWNGIKSNEITEGNIEEFVQDLIG